MVIEETKVSETSNEGAEKDIFDLANHRRFSTRKRKNIENFSNNSFAQQAKSPIKKNGVSTSKEIGENMFPLENGTEIIIRGKIKENPSFSGEVLVVQELKGRNYRFAMANPCHGLWGNSIIRSETSLVNNIIVVKPPDVPLIPIEFSLLNAVYDIRSDSMIKKYPVESTLQGWRWFNSWERLTWTTQPNHLSYQHIFEMAQAAIVDNFSPIQGSNLNSWISH